MFQGLVFIAFLVAIVAGNRAWVRLRIVPLIGLWAKQNGYDLVSAQLRGLRQGPFFLQAGRADTVHRIVVRESAGGTRSGWALCRWGMFALIHDREIIVKWDGESEKVDQPTEPIVAS